MAAAVLQMTGFFLGLVAIRIDGAEIAFETGKQKTINTSGPECGNPRFYSTLFKKEKRFPMNRRPGAFSTGKSPFKPRFVPDFSAGIRFGFGHLNRSEIWKRN
jgi:hypothetical protein